jgi:3-deoxy-manno-octulosonate cytidylyltransferase (CMP-KDO synthetase)
LGIYAYRVGFLNTFTSLPASPFEKKESLEQLRVLQNGYKIFVEASQVPTGIGVDTQEDYKALLETM